VQGTHCKIDLAKSKVATIIKKIISILINTINLIPSNSNIIMKIIDLTMKIIDLNFTMEIINMTILIINIDRDMKMRGSICWIRMKKCSGPSLKLPRIILLGIFQLRCKDNRLIRETICRFRYEKI